MTSDFIGGYLRALAGPKPEDAWHSLVEFGPDVLPDVRSAYKKATEPDFRCLLISIMRELRDFYSLDLLARALKDPASSVWKAALDAIVSIGGPRARDILVRAKTSVVAERRPWIDEALSQVRK